MSLYFDILKLKMNLSNIKQDKWYRQGVECVPWLIMYPYHAAITLFGEENSIMFSRKTHNYGYWRISTLRKLANELIEKQLKDKTVIDKLINEWKLRRDVFF